MSNISCNDVCQLERIDFYYFFSLHPLTLSSNYYVNLKKPKEKPKRKICWNMLTRSIHQFFQLYKALVFFQYMWQKRFSFNLLSASFFFLYFFNTFFTTLLSSLNRIHTPFPLNIVPYRKSKRFAFHITHQSTTEWREIFSISVFFFFFV